MDCISVDNMKRSDAYTIENFVPSLTLMYRAALGVFKAAAWSGDIAIVSGSGNNGGDGFALSCILRENGYSCRVFTVGSHLSGDSFYYAEKAKAAGVPVDPFTTGCLDGCEMIVDCLLGTGISGSLRDHYKKVIEEINTSGAYVISVDINSGMNGDTGACDLAVRSDLTVTIGYVKKGLVSQNAGQYIKRLVCADIGIVLCYEEEKITAENCPPWLDMNIIRT